MGCFGAPYCYFRETLDGAGLNNNLMTREVSFDNLQAETIGHAVFGDDRPYGASVNTNQFLRINQFEPLLDTRGIQGIATSATTKSPPGALFEMATCDECRLTNMAETGLYRPGTDGLFDVASSAMFTIDGDLATLLANTRGAANKQFLASRAAGLNWRLLGNGWEGTIVNGCGGFAVNTVLAYPAAGGACGLATGQAGEQVIGVSQGVGGDNQVVITRGTAKVVLAGPVAAAHAPLRTAAGGMAVQASGSNDTATPYFGRVLGGAAPGGATVSVVLVPAQ